MKGILKSRAKFMGLLFTISAVVAVLGAIWGWHVENSVLVPIIFACLGFCLTWVLFDFAWRIICIFLKIDPGPSEKD